MSHRVAKVRRDAVAPCFTCPLCHKLLRDATTIIECLHTFCKSCIYKKLSDEKMKRCPVCNVDLGCVPTDKLRSDHNLQAIRAKIFPYERKKEKSLKYLAPATLPAKQRERSLSSLGVSTTQSELTRTRSMARKASRVSTFTIREPVQKEDDTIENHPRRASSQERLKKYTRNLRKNSDSGETSFHRSLVKGRESGSGSRQGKEDLWKSLDSLVEAAVNSRSAKFGTKESFAKSETLHTHANEELPNKTVNKERRQKAKVQDEKSSSDQSSSEWEMPKRLRRGRPKRATNFGESKITPQVVVDASSPKLGQRNYPIWISLVSLDKEEGAYLPLPQIPAHYIRIKDGNIPVSFIQKYLTAKLYLRSEEEVEIKCMGQRVIPPLTLNDLVDLWLQTTVTDRVSVTIGSSAKEFVMVLGYSRRVPDP